LDNELNDGRVDSGLVQFAVSSSYDIPFIAVTDPRTPDAHAIYLLNLLLAFLQPKFDPSIQDDIMADDMEEGGDTPTPLPSSRDDEFRPFVRRLPEWQFWWVLLICLTFHRNPENFQGCRPRGPLSSRFSAPSPQFLTCLSTGPSWSCISSSCSS
jgi:hypothetical protein